MLQSIYIIIIITYPVVHDLVTCSVSTSLDHLFFFSGKMGLVTSFHTCASYAGMWAQLFLDGMYEVM